MDKSRVWDQHITPLCIKQAKSKDLMYSIGNQTRYLVIIYNGKEYKIYIYIYTNRFATYLKLTQHCKSTIFKFKKL